LIGNVISSLNYLIKYPHGCVEQTTSRLLPNKKRGGWGWWQSEAGFAVNHWMTSYAMYGLILAKKSAGIILLLPILFHPANKRL